MSYLTMLIRFFPTHVFTTRILKSFPTMDLIPFTELGPNLGLKKDVNTVYPFFSTFIYPS